MCYIFHGTLTASTDSRTGVQRPAEVKAMKAQTGLLLCLALLLTASGCKNSGGTSESAAAPDTGGPEILFVSPDADQVVSGTVRVTGSAEDASAIQSVTLILDEGGAGERVVDPGEIRINGHAWSYDLDTLLLLEEGAHTLTAQAVDAAGNTGAAATLSFTVNQEYPEIRITAPAHGQVVRGTLAAAGSSAASGGITVTQVRAGLAEAGVYALADGTISWTSDIDTAAYADGAYTLRAVAAADNGASGAAAVSVTVDNTPPTVALTSHADGAALTGAVDLEGTAADAVEVDKVEIAVDGGAYDLVQGTETWSYPLDTGPLSEAPHTLTFRATDTAGNTRLLDVTVYVDPTPPAVSFTDPAAGSYFRAQDFLLQGTCGNMEAGDSLEISSDGTTFNPVDVFASPYTSWEHTLNPASDGLPDGPLTVTVRATSAVSGAVTLASRAYVVDTTAPTAAFAQPAPGSSVSGQVLIGGTVSDNLALRPAPALSLDITDGTLSDSKDFLESELVAGQFSHLWDSNLYSGSCTLTLEAFDRAGNSFSTVITVNRDDSVPSIAVISPAGGSVHGGTVSLSMTAEDLAGTLPGVEVVQVSLDQASWQDALYDLPTDRYNSDLNISGLSDGPQTLYARVRDNDGNTSQTSIIIEVDNSDPVVAISYPTALNVGDGFLHGTVEAFGTAIDAHLAEVEIRIGGSAPISLGAAAAWSTSWDTAADPGAQNGLTVTVTAVDTVGNSGSDSVIVDVRPYLAALYDENGFPDSSELVGETLTLRGDNFLAGMEVVFPAGAGSVTAAAAVTDSHSAGVEIPDSASSGEIIVRVQDPALSWVESNSLHLDVWDLKSVEDSDKVAQQDTEVSGSATYQVFFEGGGTKALYLSVNSAAKKLVESGISGGGGNFPSIALDGGTVHLAYTDGGSDLRYARTADGGTSYSVQTDLVSGGAVNAATSIAVYPAADPAENVIGVTYQASDSSLGYIVSHDNGATWGSPETVDSGPGAGSYSALAFDTDGHPLVVYYDAAGYRVKFAYHTGLFWQSGFLEDEFLQGEYPAIAADAAGGVHISYFDGNEGDLKYAYAPSRSADFTVTTVDSGGITGLHTGLGLDGAGRPHIAYINSFTYPTLRYAFYDGDGWVRVSPPNRIGLVSGSRLSLALMDVDGTDIPYLGYTDGEDAGQLIYRP
jgi:hypothetical protein